jgi:hypothetical protein
MTSVVRAKTFAPLLFLAACTAEAPPTSAPPPELIEAVATPPPSRPAAACEPTPLAVHKDGRGFVDRLHASIAAFDDEQAYFLVDTGSQTSFAVAPPENWNAPRSTSTVIACKGTTLPVVTREPASTPGGAIQRGVLGLDLVRWDAVLDLDLRGGTLSWYGAPARALPASATIVPLEWKNGWLVASGVVVDGKPVKLVLDTGSPHVFLMGQTPRDGEVEIHDTDGTGAPVTYYTADGDVALPGRRAMRVPVDRAADFPTLEKIIADVGGDVSGLLGIGVLGDRRVVIEKTQLAADL